MFADKVNKAELLWGIRFHVIPKRASRIGQQNSKCQYRLIRMLTKKILRDHQECEGGHEAKEASQVCFLSLRDSVPGQDSGGSHVLRSVTRLPMSL